MRARRCVATAIGAIALMAGVSPASAATGDFGYTYTDSDGNPQYGELMDPKTGACTDLPEEHSPAHSPLNRTNEFALVFTGPGCTGEEYTLRPYVGGGHERLQFRSVAFLPCVCNPPVTSQSEHLHR
ncbi:hypothetical protein C9F11_44725 (plasmid) [Streptomyces sp. YIM 121038]|nr:hypothetical protein C9F11_44725 [Streptomyces sp. YIM 121038]